MKKFFTLIAVAVMAFAAQATEMTVCDGTETSNYVPIYGLYTDVQGTMGQMIYSADMLTDMVGKEITGVKFYSPRINFYDVTLQVGMAVTDQTDFEDYAAVEGATILGTAQPNEFDTELTFVFDQPFLYEGGNLMVQVVVTKAGEWNGTAFYGQSTNYYYSYYQYQYSWSDTPSKWNVAFLPKATFTYEGSDVPPVDPTEKTGAPVFNGYTTDGIHAYFVEILPTDEGSVIYYRVLYPGEEEYTEWAVYDEILSFEGDGKHRVEAYAVAPNKLPSEQIAYEFVVEPEPPTSISEMMNGKTVAGVRYFNLAGQEVTEANGLTIVVTTYTDGTTSAVKVMK